MSTYAEIYSKVIDQWAEATGLPPWSPEEDMHFELDGTVIGLVHNEEAQADRLQIYIDLGSAERPELYKSLLELNVPMETADAGCFGIHPGNGSVVYRTSVALGDDLNGAELPGQIHQMLQGARARLHAI